MAEATLKTVAEFFMDKSKGDTLSKFSTEWKELDDKSKVQIKAGIGDGSLNY